MKVEQRPSDVALEQFHAGLKKALADDGRIGPNDAPALRALALRANRPDLATIVDRFQTNYVPPERHARLTGTGYATSVVSFKPGPGGGFNASNQALVLGRPEGAGGHAGSLHVVSTGVGGEITLKLGRAVSVGLKVFENGIGPNGQAVNPEPARVEVSADGQSWFALNGSAGRSTVSANSTNGIAPRDGAAGGDRFLFADSGIPAGTKIQYVRITDLGQSTGPGGAGGTAGFDLDAVYGF